MQSFWEQLTRQACGLCPQQSEVCALRQHIQHLLKAGYKPVGAILHLLSHLDTTVSNEGACWSMGTSIQICCPISEHDRGFVTFLALHHLQHFGLATRGRCGRRSIEARVVALCVKENFIRVDHLLRDVKLQRNGLNHVLESPRNKIHVSSLLVQHLDNLLDARRPLGNTFRLDALFKFVLSHPMVCHELKTLGHCILELDVAIHGLVREFRNLLHDPEAFPDQVNALCGNNRTIHVEENSIRFSQQSFRALYWIFACAL
mmetsp:Transcript_73483/g.172111  ORF Transcript_73483/g.172111 Transcript_73483/m.172111 type:complete len:260 (-) Transcript_73483:206-985(-)